jgi:hypothetical protein
MRNDDAKTSLDDPHTKISENATSCTCMGQYLNCVDENDAIAHER